MKRIFCLFLLFLLGCSSSEVVEVREKKVITNPKAYDFIIEEQYPGERPIWTYNLESVKDKYSRYELFTGISTFAKDEYAATKLAESNAINQIATYIGVYIESRLESRSYKESSSNSEEVRISIEEESSQIVENFANSLKLLEKYVEKGQFYDPRGFWRPYTRVIVLYGIEKNVIN